MTDISELTELTTFVPFLFNQVPKLLQFTRFSWGKSWLEGWLVGPCKRIDISQLCVVIREYGRQGKGAPRWDLYLFVGRNILRCILTDTGFHVADNDNQFEL